MKAIGYFILLVMLISIFSEMHKTHVENTPGNKQKVAAEDQERLKKRQEEKQILSSSIDMDSPELKFTERGNSAYLSVKMNVVNKTDKIIRAHIGQLTVYNADGVKLISAQIEPEGYILPDKPLKLNQIVRLSAGSHQKVIAAGGGKAISAATYEATVIFFDDGSILGS